MSVVPKKKLENIESGTFPVLQSFVYEVFTVFVVLI